MHFHFLDEEHKKGFESFIEEAGIHLENRSLVAPLLLISSIPSVRQQMDKVYSISGGYFNPDTMEEFSLSTGERILFSLAMNLYNGCIMEEIPLYPNYVMGYLDKEHQNLVLEALTYRYSIH